MGYLTALWDLDYDPTDSNNPNGTYTPYTFIPADFSHDMAFRRREGVLAIPGMDDVLDQYGRAPAPMERRDWKSTFRVWPPHGNHDAARDLLMAQVAPGVPQRLVYQTDGGALWYTTGHFRACDPDVATPTSFLYHDFTVTWRIRPDWRPRFSEASDVWGYGDGIWGTSDGNWGGPFLVALTSTVTNFSVDATGEAGNTLPTLPDTGPVITITGPFGADAGILLTNGTAHARDTAGVLQPVTLLLPKVLVNQELVVDCGAQRFTIAGVPFRPIKGGAYQREWFRIEAGRVNSLSATAFGANPTTGGGLILDWWKKRA